METRRRTRRRPLLARQLDDAFAGCERWDTAPPRRRRAAGVVTTSFGVAGPIALAQAEYTSYGRHL